MNFIKNTDWKKLFAFILVLALCSYISYDAGEHNGQVALCEEMGGTFGYTKDNPDPSCYDYKMESLSPIGDFGGVNYGP